MSGERPLLKFLAFSVVCAAFAAWLIVTIGNIDPFADRTTYQAAITDATGLVENDAVKVAGVVVGKVESVGIERGLAVITFSVRSDLRLGQDTTVAVRWRNLLGLRYLYVYPAGEGELPDGYRFPPERTLAVTDFGRLMDRLVPIQRALEPEVGNLVVEALNDALADREARIQDLIVQAGDLTGTLADRDEQIGRVLSDGAALADAYARREEELRSFLGSFADVATTVAARNDELERIVIELAEAQAELSRFLETNFDEIQGTIDGLDEITGILSVNHSNLEDIVTHLGRGLAFYHRTSRWGQWFNIRVVGFSDGGEPVSSERGACLPVPVPPEQQEPGGGGSEECQEGQVFSTDDLEGGPGLPPASLDGPLRAGLRTPPTGGDG